MFIVYYTTFNTDYIEEKSFTSKLSAKFFLQEKGYKQQTPLSYKKSFDGWFGDTTATIMKMEEAK